VKWIALVALGLLISTHSFCAINLLDRYPTQLNSGDTAGERARAWDFGEADVFRLSEFKFAIGSDLRVDVREADLGIGHSKDGAVWAVVIPTTEAQLTSQPASKPEKIAHIWLRFHPAQIARLFPPDTLATNGNAGAAFQMRAIASAKMRSSWQAGGKALIPEPKDLTLDLDTTDGVRRFFVIDTEAKKADYISAFEKQPFKAAPGISPELAGKAFDQLWEAFDREYAMFVLRPEVDWARLREQYRPRALKSKSTVEFANICAEMLRPLRDLHIWLTVAGNDVPVFNRERVANANPAAFRSIIGDLKSNGRIQWAVASDRIGFVAIYGWNGAGLAEQFDGLLESMRDTRGLIVDVRLNGGGSEDIAREVAGRFLDEEFVYGYSQFRNGANHTNLTERYERKVKPRGPWRYEHPVILLIGQKCMSSSESFVAMMSGAPQVTIMGDHTCGSSGNPKSIKLPLEIAVSVPRWIDYLPDGTPLDEKGFQPKEQFTSSEDSFRGNRDELLKAALEKLRGADIEKSK
jgi:hypothetical protein